MPVTSQRQMILQRQRVEKGLCYKCPNPREEGTRWCTEHRLYHRDYMERYRQKKRQQQTQTAIEPRVCRVCQSERPAQDFYRPYLAAVQIWTVCKACHRQAVRDGIRKEKAHA